MFERLLALGVLIGVIAYSVYSGVVFTTMDWTLTDSFYELIYRVLLLVIGLELVRMLVVHDLMAILELLAFVIARKMLKPDIVAVDIVLAVTAFVALLAARRYLIVAAPTFNGDDSIPNANYGKREH
ncbi:MAG: hypothetical protein AB1453_11200 [Chloroflexota bacterium]